MGAPSFLSKPSVQGYIDQPGGINHSEWSSLAAPGQPTIYGTGPANSQQYLSSFTFSTGALGFEQNIQSAPGINILFQGAPCLDQSGAIWCMNAGAEFGVATALCHLESNGSAITLADTWGGISGNPPTGWTNLAASMVFLTMGSTHWLVQGAFVASNSSYSILVARADPPAYPGGHFGFWGHAYNDSMVLAGNTSVCAGPQNSSSATAYWTVQPESIFGATYGLGSTLISAGADSYDPSTWPTANPDIVSTLIKSYAPTDFDAGWTSFTFFSGPAYDRTDGNVLIEVAGGGGGGGPYIAKISVADGSVLWKCAVANGDGFDNQAFALSRIAVGYLLYWAPTSAWAGTCYLIGTADGSFATADFTGIGAFGQQVSDDIVGGLIGNVGWSSGEGQITLLNSTPSSGGSLGTVYFVTPSSPVGGQQSYFDVWGQ